MAAIDAYVDRVSDDFARDWDASVEAVRIGTVAAHDANFYQRWRRTPKSKPVTGKRLTTDAALEAAVMGIAAMFPGNVVRVRA